MYEAGGIGSGPDDCILVSDPAEYFYGDLATLFTNLKPKKEEVGLTSYRFRYCCRAI